MNNEIRVYDPALNFIGIIEDHTALIWTRRYYEPGGFELHAPITNKNLLLLRQGNIITKRGSIEAAVIEDVENTESADINEAIRRGRFLSSYLDRRLIKNTVNYKGSVEKAMRQLVSGVEPIPLVGLGQLQGFTEQVEFQATMKNLATVLTKLASASQLGYRLRPDFKKKKLVFEVYKGADKTTAQGVNARVIFSEAYENINNTVYRYNDQNYRTYAVIGGEGEGADRVYVTIGGGTGLALRELFVDARDLTSSGLTTEAYRAALIQRGYEKLAENAIAESIECETGADVNFKYKTDYDLGDVVTIEKRKWGIKMHQRITELAEVYEHGGMYVVPTMGDALPDKLDLGD